jgi:magnesium-transporting ATPase (P-type)
MIHELQSNFLKKRQRLIRAWRYIGPVMLLGIAGFISFVFVSSPLLINPFEIISRLEHGDIERTTLETMTVMLPVVFIMVSFLLVFIVMIMYASFSNERKYLQMLGQAGVTGAGRKV